ncbi:MAG: CoA-binding protein, partial [Candidatus Eremiobacteraeota bacterium]|nr:CoA-binding protein [Candidatus Eremiobacteraeota bacterium]
MILVTAAQRWAVLERTRRIAMVGASNNLLRPSYTVFSYLRSATSYDVSPINPRIAEIDGVKAYPSLAAYAAERGAPDVVDVFRKPSELLAVVDEAVAAGAKVIWFQYGVVNDEAVVKADAAGLDVVVDRCLKVEYARFHGGLATAGLNSGIITSRR